MMDIKKLFVITSPEERREGLWPAEWAMLAYTTFTLVLMAVLWPSLVNPLPMLGMRAAFLGLIAAGWLCYRLYPSSVMAYLRTAAILVTLSRWYPDLYEFNRLFVNLDHLFAGWEESLFGCQPSLVFSQLCPSKWVSEPLNMGYFAYFPMIWLLITGTWLARPQLLQRFAFVVMGGFFVYYLVYLFLPVAGPQYYYAAPGVDAQNGIFPAMGHYFHEMHPMFPAAGSEGFFHDVVNVAHEAGERPMAAFPSSHIGVSTILLLLAARSRQKWLFFILLPFYLLLCAATVYIHAHYLVDAIAGFVSAFVVYFLLNWAYTKIWGNN